MNEAGQYVEYIIARELYGNLLSLATRPLSKGNDIALRDAKSSIEACIDKLSARHTVMLSNKKIEMIKNMLEMSDFIPLQSIAGTIVSSLHRMLKSHHSELNYWPVLNGKCPVGYNELERLVVTVGPTIGLGDEFILAKALIRRSNQCNILLYVETKRIDLWNCIDRRIQHLGEPPLSSVKYFNTLSVNELRKTGYVYADFLKSDPAEIPPLMGQNLAFCGRWIFGDASGLLADTSLNRIFSFRYPKDMPLSRNMQCDWLAGRFCRRDGIKGESSGISVPTVKTETKKSKTILLQTLTSKPQLIFSPQFYLRCFSALRRITDEKFSVIILPGPTERSRLLTDAVFDTMTKGLHGCSIERKQSKSLADVLSAVRNSDLLFGPDTFTSHIAAVYGIPQVTIHLPEHHAWRNPATKSFYLKLETNIDNLDVAAARRIAFILGIDKLSSDSWLHNQSELWKNGLQRLGEIIRQHTYGNQRYDLREAENIIQQFNDIFEDHQSIMRKSIGIHAGDLEDRYSRVNCNVDFRQDSYEGLLNNLSLWFNNAGCTDLSGVLFCL